MKLIQNIQNPYENLDLPMDFKKILMKKIRKPIIEDFCQIFLISKNKSCLAGKVNSIG